MSLDFLVYDPRFAIILALLFSRLKNYSFKSPLIGITINLTGTILHELCHFIVALILNAKPSGFSLIPIKTSSGWVLGSVSVMNLRWYNALPVAIAPLLILFVAFIFDGWYGMLPFEHNILFYLGYLVCMVILVENAIPSWQDLIVGVHYFSGVIFYVAIGVIFYSGKGIVF